MLYDMIIDDSFVLFLLSMIGLKMIFFIFEKRKSQEMVEIDV